MFDQLTDRLSRVAKQLSGQGRITEDNIRDSLRQVRMALLEADVALPVVRDFINDAREAALGQQVLKSLTPGQVFIKIVRDKLTTLMGEHNDALNLTARPPVIILLAGLQGAGKTTTAAKLAYWLKNKQGKQVALASVDVYRPAAREQLKKLSAEVGAFYCDSDSDKPIKIAQMAVSAAERQGQDVLIIDTAGRLHIDGEMMLEIRQLYEDLQPTETLFVLDSMTGQDAVNTAAAFHKTLPLTGVILTKIDGDSRGGAALSVRHVTSCPVKFIGEGEKVSALTPFYPDRIASRILGMGDVLSLVDQAQEHVNETEARKMAQKLKKGKGFDFNDLRQQMQQMQKMGGMQELLDKLPGMGMPAKADIDTAAGEKEVKKTIAIIDSMTPKERRFPAIIKGSRKRRIALGSGTQVQDINRLMKQMQQMQKMMKRFGKGKMGKLLGKMPGSGPRGFTL